MKQNSSEITTTPKDQHSKIGTLLGGHGLEMLRSLPDHVPPEQMEDITRSWRDLLHTPLVSKIERDALEEAINKLYTPAPAKWITGRIASLLAQYFQGDISEGMMKSIADDWYHELKDFPAWSISKAVRWWIGKDNPDRRKKPMTGDIAERAQKELGLIIVAQSAIRRFDTGFTPKIEQKPKERMSKKRADEIVEEIGFSVKRF
jgi:hypothetical protein